MEMGMCTIDKNGYGEALSVMNEIKASLATLEPKDKTAMVLSVAPGLAADSAAGSFGPSSLDTAKMGLDLIRRWW
jgi:hypothetical protein